MDDQNTPAPSTPIYQESQEKNAKWLWLLIFLIIIGAIAFAFFRGIGPFASISPFTKQVSPTPTSSPFVESSPLTESSPQASAVDKSVVKVRVLNGSGTTGKAASVKDFLEGLGWKVVTIGNADSSDFATTEVRFRTTTKDYETAIVDDLSDKYSAKASSDNLESTDSADIEVIVGAK
ncbi:MAG: LytR C-terminal domain-containing protein [Patescibacteria group bacterium]